MSSVPERERAFFEEVGRVFDREIDHIAGAVATHDGELGWNERPEDVNKVAAGQVPVVRAVPGS
jgi:hypothetical protein